MSVVAFSQKKDNVTITNSTIEYLNKSITLVPGETATEPDLFSSVLFEMITPDIDYGNDIEPSIINIPTLKAMQNNKQLSSKRFIDLIGKDAEIDYNNWSKTLKKKTKTFSIIGLVGTAIGLASFNAIDGESDSIFYISLGGTLTGIFGIYYAIDSKSKLKKSKKNTDLLIWSNQKNIEKFVEDYNYRLQKSLQ